MINVLFIVPLSVNGGIASWAKTYLHTFNDSHYKLYPVDYASRHRRPTDTSIIKRVFWGIVDLIVLRKRIKAILKSEDITIMHIATSGNIGSLRDIVIGHLCKKKCKIILHCHYGCITNDINKNNIVSWLTMTALKMYDQIWVLDKKSCNTLNRISQLKNKVFLTPNPINIIYPKDLVQKKFNSIAFLGNLIPSKGIYELVEAVLRCDNIRLDLIGPGDSYVIDKIKELAGKDIDNKIFLHGYTPHDKAMELIKGIDILALPTYYSFEAFPISILEAMSLTKLVISTNRAAISDILTALDGSQCGIIVQERSIDDLVKAIKFCQEFPEEANIICLKAYEKVKQAYSIDFVYALYASNYNKLLNK